VKYSLSSWDIRRKLFLSRALRRIFGPERQGVKGAMEDNEFSGLICAL